ncbi:MAG: GHMP kinase [candidate division KSB1 bacterium]|nr:GHMP kinase [candidate division KSB1 bacterium]
MEVDAERKEIRNFARELHLFFPGFFHGEGPVLITRAPGRLDVMGGIADYSGSLVLELPLDRATFVAIQARTDRHLVVTSWNAVREGWQERVEWDLGELWTHSGPLSYQAFREKWGKDPGVRWVRYVLGGPLALARRGLIDPNVRGANVAIRSTVPLGAGVSSSASLEVASLMAFCALWGVKLEPLQIALIAQEVENQAVGAPCGVMDQVTAVSGKRDQLLAILCQPAEVVDSIPVPEGLAFSGIDTGVKHSVAGDRYRNTRVATFMGRKIIGTLRRERGEPDIPGGYLCNLTPQEFTRKYRPFLPVRMAGSRFLAEYGDLEDPATDVDPDTVYAVRSRTEHPIRENHRVRQFMKLLQAGQTEEAFVKAGRLMYASHWSYSRLCGLGAKEADFLVRAVRELGPEKGFYGAKITGGGAGGTVAILAKKESRHLVRRISERYASWVGHHPDIFWGSSHGAAWVGAVRV